MDDELIRSNGGTKALVALGCSLYAWTKWKGVVGRVGRAVDKRLIMMNIKTSGGTILLQNGKGCEEGGL